jgi:hypothetical protein
MMNSQFSRSPCTRLGFKIKNGIGGGLKAVRDDKSFGLRDVRKSNAGGRSLEWNSSSSKEVLYDVGSGRPGN